MFYGVRNHADTVGGTIWLRPKDPLKGKYHWFDSAAYEDPHKKLWWVFKRTSTAAFFYASFDCYHEDVMFSGKPNAIFHHYAKIMLPLYGWAFSMAGGIILCATIRQKDDRYNYWIGGGLGCWPWLSKYAGSWGKGAVYCMPAAVILYFVKYTWDYDVIVKPRGGHIYQREINICTGGSLGEGDYTFGWGVPERPRVAQKN